MKKNKRYARIDYWLLTAVMVLVGFGVVMVYSTSYYKLLSDQMAPDAILMSSIRYVVFGLFGLVAAIFIDYRIWRRFAGAIYIVAIVLSIVVLFFGVETKGGTRWLVLPIIKISFMPSEFAKLAVVIGVARWVEIVGDRIKSFKSFFAMFTFFMILAGLTVLQRDLSTTIIIAGLGMLMLFVGGARWYHIAATGLTLGGGGLYVALKSFEHARARLAPWLSSFLDRSYIYNYDDNKHQIINSIYAIGNGGITGRGLGMSELKLLYLPEVYNDFIFAIICEEFGLIGATLVLVAFAFIIYRIFRVALNCVDTFGYMMVAGTAILIGLHVIINVGVVVNLLPTTGITLPFISKGGTSVFIMMFLIGVVLNVSRKNSLER